MPTEIERKFLVSNDLWRSSVVGTTRIKQGYLAVNERCGVRVRISGAKASLNVKSAGIGIARTEYEYAIPVADAEEMLAQFGGAGQIVKTRYYVNHGPDAWEVDVFEGANLGLVVAEIELGSEQQEVRLPGWVGREVSGDPRYLNNNLAERPYATWTTAGPGR